MSLASLVLAVFLILLGATWLEWITITTTVLGVLAFVAGVLMVLEGFGSFSYKVGNRQ